MDSNEEPDTDDGQRWSGILRDGVIRLGNKWIKGVILLLVFGSALESRAEELNPETTAVRYVFASSVERQLYGWIQEEVADEWFDGDVPKICHVCDNVYRHATDNGSIITRGTQNMHNRRILAQMMGVEAFLVIIARQYGETVRIEAALHDLATETPRFSKHLEWSRPWFD